MTGPTVIVGGGLAAQRAAETLRRAGDGEPIVMVCAEDRAPYDRPPLSKGALTGAHGLAELALRADGWHAGHEVELVLGTPAAALDLPRRRVALRDGRELRFGRLLIATGALPRRLPGSEGLENVHVLRSDRDAAALAADLTPGARLLVLGAGLIGLEAASSARALGCEVTVVEPAPGPMAAVLGTRFSDWLTDLHRRNGVTVHTGVGVERLLSNRNRATGARLADGTFVECDAVLVAIGVDPATGWLDGSPLAGNGIPTDGVGATSVPGVFAAGDAARRWDPHAGAHVRRDHWENAARGGAAAARAMLGLPAVPEPPPMFWSDQHGIRIQGVGHPAGGELAELDGLPGSDDFTAVFHGAGRPAAALLAGRPDALAAVRRRIAEAAHPLSDDHEEAA